MKKLILLLLITLINCGNELSEYRYTPPLNINDELNTGTLEEVQMDIPLISKTIEKIKSGKFNDIHSILIYKEDKLVLEEYFNGHQYQWNAPKYHGEIVQWKKETMHPIISCTKSITSACIGIAIDKGFIANVQDKITDYLPGYKGLLTNGKEEITIEHLLTMTSGLEWDEWSTPHGTSANDIDRLYLVCSNDPVRCILEKKLLHQPGETFTYNGGGIIVLGEILKSATGMDIREFSQKHLFKPLRIEKVQWRQFNNGVFATDGSIQLQPRDMLKIGIVYLNNGTWKDKLVISKEWIAKSSVVYANNHGINLPIEDSGKNGYSYTWWTSELKHNGNIVKMYRAGGWGGQSIMVFHDLNMVIVFTGGNYASRSKLYRLIKNYVLPSIKIYE
ncbi:MAG: beta-lactamase family protein [Bacteroidales bacterium]|nr:beta-lactamase family protein [Bacteroidales bacterium]